MADPGGTLSAAQVTQEIIQESLRKHVDPRAALSIVPHEGGFQAAPGTYDPDTQGNPGWSYGPFQLRSPGGLPIESSGAYGPGYYFAWSKDGVDYAVDQIATVAQGETGLQAITDIVTRFERPANAQAEIQKAYDTYKSMNASGGIITTGPSGTPSTGPGGVQGGINSAVGAAGGAVKSATGAFSSVEDAFNFIFSYRFLEILGGGALIIIGLVGLMREVGVKSPTLPGPAGKIANSGGS